MVRFYDLSAAIAPYSTEFCPYLIAQLDPQLCLCCLHLHDKNVHQAVHKFYHC